MNDRFRGLTRSAPFEFWFVLDKEGGAPGEIELNYDSVLMAENLPSVALLIAGLIALFISPLIETDLGIRGNRR